MAERDDDVDGHDGKTLEDSMSSSNDSFMLPLTSATSYDDLKAHTMSESHPAPKNSGQSKSRKRSSLESVEDADSDDALDVQSRKEKSLGLLCQRFLTAMGDESRKGNEIHLESVARKMMVEKRRIYDIVNVMEALEAMTKTNKSFYRWDGLTYLPQLMAQLQKEAAEEGLPERIARVEQAMCSFTELAKTAVTGRTLATEIVGTMVTDKNDDNDSGYWGGSQEQLNRPPTATGVEQPKTSTNAAVKPRSIIRFTRDRNGRNSLAQLCRRFLMVLLCSPNNKRRVSLDVASTVLIKDPETEGFEPPSRSRCRRLYDIANVLVAMGLIKKVHYLFGTKKIPLFVYSGPEPNEQGRLEAQDPDSLENTREDHENYVAKKKLALAASRSAPKPLSDSQSQASPIAPSLQRHASLMDICEIAERERKRLNGDLHSASPPPPSEDAQSERQSSESPNENRNHSVIRPKSIVAKPKPQQFVRHTSTDGSGRQYLVRIGNDFHIQSTPASQTTVGLHANKQMALSLAMSRRAYSSPIIGQQRFLPLMTSMVNQRPFPPPAHVNYSPAPLRQINQLVPHSVTSILSSMPVNMSRQAGSYRIASPPKSALNLNRVGSFGSPLSVGQNVEIQSENVVDPAAVQSRKTFALGYADLISSDMRLPAMPEPLLQTAASDIIPNIID
uniref:E2F/DP family winged-helix DNA-binding domain-containing protein n=1 Tax=Plectus sambesii TaxID=2011161 RepID=A0A914W733_9BILA